MKPLNLNQTIKLSLLAVITLAVLNLIGSNLLATGGRELNDLNHEYQTLKKENAYLKNQIASQNSLSSLETWADDHGFVKIQKPIALTTPAPVAFAY